MKSKQIRSYGIAGIGLFLLLTGLGGCSHGSDDTGGNSSMGSMSGTTGRQFTQSNANQSGPAAGATGGSGAGSGRTNSAEGVSTGGSGTSGASMGTTGSGNAPSTAPGSR